MEKALILESDWRPHPQAAPSQPHRASVLYSAVLRSGTLAARCQRLSAATLQQDCQAFLRLPENRRGANLLVFSSHGEWRGNGRYLAAADGVLCLETHLQSLRPRLSRSLLVLDACFVGQQLPLLCAELGLLGAVGFTQRVNWTASSACLLGLLRAWLAAGVLCQRRADSRCPARVLAQMQAGSHARLMQSLGISCAWKHQLPEIITHVRH